MRIDEVLAEATRALNAYRVPESRLTAELLLADQLRLDRPALYAHGKESLPDAGVQAYRELVRRRVDGEPLQYITGVQEFYGREFRVDPSVLIPRPETELLVETVLELNDPPAPSIVDVGTGSGCIALTLALEIADSRILATDVSLDALRVAQENARRLGAHVSFAAMDGLAGLAGPFRFVLSNPPYVDADEYPGLQREVRDHEPRLALVPEVGPIRFYESLVHDAERLLTGGGHLVLEIGYSMDDAIRELLGDGWTVLPTRTDLQGIPRIVVARRD